jgi:cholesterol transport system auxiliary component
VNRLIPGMMALAGICLAACTGSLFQSKVVPPAVYMLSAGIAPAGTPPPAVGAPSAGGPTAGGAAGGGPAVTMPIDLAVLKPRLRMGLESDRIAVLYPDRRLDYFADARWSGPLADVLQDLVLQEFHSRANLRTVSSDASVFSSTYWLEIEVTDFQAEYTSAAAAPTVHAHFLARIGSSGDRRILGQFDASAEQPAADNRLTAIVDAYSRAADAALTEIVAHVDQTLARASEAR